MIKYRYLGLFVFSLIPTDVMWAKPCASSGGKDNKVLIVRVPLSAKDILGTVVSKETLNDMAFQKASEITQKTYGSYVNIGEIVFQPTFVLNNIPYKMNLPMSFDGQTSIGGAIQSTFLEMSPQRDPWDCNPRENTRWEPCCQECADEGIAEWYEVKFLFNRGFILHNQEKIARKKATRHIVYI